MDYYPRNPELETFSLNWEAHSYVASLPEQLGADLSDWGWTNDGDYVPERMCKAWTRVISSAVDTLAEVELPGGTYESEARSHPVIKGRFSLAATYGVTAEFLQSRKTTLKDQLRLRPIVEETKRLLTSFAYFLENCGGCEQW